MIMNCIIFTVFAAIMANGESDKHYLKISLKPSSPMRSGNILNGQHLNAIWALWAGPIIGNKTVFGSKINGPVFELIAKRFNFTFSYLPVTEFLYNSNNQTKGLVQYVYSGECDVFFYEGNPNEEHFKTVDYTLPWGYYDLVFLIPKPEPLRNNLAAVIKPFQWPIWLGMVLSIVVIIFSIILMEMKRMTPKELAKEKEHRYVNYAYLYVFGILVSQGGPCIWQNQSIRIVACAWCLASFVLVNSYSTTLITYVIAHRGKPIIETAYDIAHRPYVNVIINKGRAMETTLSAPNLEGIYKVMSDRVNAYPKSKCTHQNECVSLVKDYRYNAFVSVSTWIVDAMISDFKMTQQCNVQMTKEPLSRTQYSWVLKKNSIYTDYMNKGLLEVQAFGFYDDLLKRVRPIPTGARRCFHTNPRQASQTRQTLTLNNLYGAFVVLFLGSALSFIAFLAENFAAVRSKQKRTDFGR